MDPTLFRPWVLPVFLPVTKTNFLATVAWAQMLQFNSPVILPALALGVEKPEPRVMQRKPRKRHAPLVTNRLVARAVALGSIETILCFLAYFALSRSFGYTGQAEWTQFSPGYIQATTVFFLGVVAAQIGNALACRTEVDPMHHLGFFSNPYLWGGLAGMVLLALTLIFVPFLAEAFHMAPPPSPTTVAVPT